MVERIFTRQRRRRVLVGLLIGGGGRRGGALQHGHLDCEQSSSKTNPGSAPFYPRAFGSPMISFHVPSG